MKQLAPDLFERSFSDLMEIGRAQLPSLAPDWTDHNAHDPGITLMELLAWVGEAQLYSLARRPRRDERTAYAALFGLVAGGTRPAQGLLWPDHGDPNSPAATFVQSVVIGPDAVVNVLTDDNPTFRPTHKILWVPGRVQRLEARLANGDVRDLTAANERGGPAFLPFGECAGPRDVLAMTFQCRGDAGLFGAKRNEKKGALLAIGVRADSTASSNACHSPLTATFVDDEGRVPLRISSDTTSGLLSSGALLLDLDGVARSPRAFTIELRSASGFARPPRLLRIEPGVIPIQQGRDVDLEPHDATGVPDFSFQLDEPGLRFAAGDEPVAIEVAEPAGLTAWTRRDRLSDAGPGENVFELDTRRGRVTFGNGINGRIPPANSQVLASYAISDGERGNVARNRRWKVTGIAGVFGTNPDPIAGGAASSSAIDQRRAARRLLADEHALVSSDDLVKAAKALPLLEVVRAWVLPPHEKAPRTGALTLVVMRNRPGDQETSQIPETARWLEAIRRRLAPRMPLGTRLVVAAPRYVDFSIDATLLAEPGSNPATVKEEVARSLGERLRLRDRKAGAPVAKREVGAWLRAVEGVKRVAGLQLIRLSDGKADEEIKVLRGGLPRFLIERSRIEVRR